MLTVAVSEGTRALPPIEEGALSGAFVVAHRSILRERCGELQVREALATLPPEWRAAFTEATPTTWVPAAVVDAFYRAMAARLSRDVADLHVEIAQLVSERMIRTVWRILLQLTTDTQLVAQVPVFYAKTWNRGTLTARSTGRGRAQATLIGWPGAPEFVLRGVRIAIVRALQLAGRRAPRVESEATEDGARFDAEWEP